MESDLTITILSTTTLTSTITLTGTLVSGTTSILPMATYVNEPVVAYNGNSSPYEYNPSLPPAVLFTILYFLTTIHHGYLAFYLPTRPETINKHRYMIPTFVASLLPTIGYLIRCISIHRWNSFNIALLMTSKTLIIIAPIFLCATLYVLLARLISRCLPVPTVPTPTRANHHSTTTPPQSTNTFQRFLHLPPTLLSFLFLSSDALSFLIQLVGAILLTTSDHNTTPITRGMHIILAGLALQLSTFLLYLVTLHLFCRRVTTSPTHGFNPCILKVVMALWLASGLVLLRIVFRLVEFAQGADGYAYTHEWVLYVFEAVPVWFAVAALAWWHPIKWVQERGLATGQEILGRRGRGVQRRDGVVVRKDGDGQLNGYVRRRSRAGHVA